MLALKHRLAVAEGLLRRLIPRRRNAGGTLNILMVDDLVPDPLLGAGYPRAFEIVRSMVKAGHRVSFYAMEASFDDVRRMTVAFGGAVQFRQGTGTEGLRRCLAAQGSTVDVLFVSRPTPMKAVADLGWGGTRSRVVYDAEAVLAPREARRRVLYGPAWRDEEYRSALKEELALARGAQTVTAVSMEDACRIEAALGLPVVVLAHRVDVQASATPFDARRDLLFVGRLTGAANANANVDSVVWFVTEVMPALDAMIGTEWVLHIAGLIDAPEIDALVSARVVRHGVVDDLAPLYAQCRLFVAPTRFAAGIPIKVVEAMGWGIPCVATPLLAKQLDVDATVLPTGDTPQAFAAECRRLYTDAQAWRSVRDAAIGHVGQTFSQTTFDGALDEALAQATRRRATVDQDERKTSP